jgi:hypothetical protein
MATRALKPANSETVEDVLSQLGEPIVHPNLSAAMAEAFAEIEGATKSATNPHFKSKYADLTSIIEAIKPPLIRHGLFFTQRCIPSEDGVSVETVLHHSSGEKEGLGTLYVPANKRDPQGFGSALTYARRYALQTAFGVPTEDDDGNAAVATARPSKGEARPDNSADERLPEDLGRSEGEMSSSSLRASLRLLVHHINGCASVADLEDVLDTEDAKDVIDNCKRRFPAWWETGENMPAEFVPLKSLIEQTRKGLKDLENA